MGYEQEKVDSMVGILLLFTLITLPAPAAAQGRQNYFTLEKAISQALESSYKIKRGMRGSSRQAIS